MVMLLAPCRSPFTQRAFVAQDTVVLRTSARPVSATTRPPQEPGLGDSALDVKTTGTEPFSIQRAPGAPEDRTHSPRPVLPVSA